MEFYTSTILREINRSEITATKTAILTLLEALNFGFNELEP